MTAAHPLLTGASGDGIVGALRVADFQSAATVRNLAPVTPSVGSSQNGYTTWDEYRAPTEEPKPAKPPLRIKRVVAATLLDLGGLWPLEDSIEFARCEVCRRRIRVDAYCEHVGACSDTGEAAAENDAVLDEKKAKRKKSKRELNLDTMCGVVCFDRGNMPCMRSLSCKTHPIKLKRLVEGRSKPYDELLQVHEIAMGRGPNGAAGTALRARSSSGGSASHKAATPKAPAFVVSRDVGPLERAKRRRTNELARAFAAPDPANIFGHPGVNGLESFVEIPPAAAAPSTGEKKRKLSRRRKFDMAQEFSIRRGPPPAAVASYGGSIRTLSGALCWSSSDLLFHSVLQRFEDALDGEPDDPVIGQDGLREPQPAFVTSQDSQSHEVLTPFLPPIGAASVVARAKEGQALGMSRTIEDNTAHELFYGMMGAEGSIFGSRAEFSLSGSAFDVEPVGEAAGDARAVVPDGSQPLSTSEAATAVASPNESPIPPGRAKRPRRNSRSAAVKPPTPTNVAVAMPPSSPTTNAGKSLHQHPNGFEAAAAQRGHATQPNAFTISGGASTILPHHVGQT